MDVLINGTGNNQGKTTAPMDDRLIRWIGLRHLLAVAGIAVVVYAMWGLALPSLLGAGLPLRLSFNTEGAVFAGAILFARLPCDRGTAPAPAARADVRSPPSFGSRIRAARWRDLPAGWLG